MAHKNLIGGTAYDVVGGRTLVGGTGYDVTSGRTLVGGTGYDVPFVEPFVIYDANGKFGTYYQRQISYNIEGSLGLLANQSTYTSGDYTLLPTYLTYQSITNPMTGVTMSGFGGTYSYAVSSECDLSEYSTLNVQCTIYGDCPECVIGTTSKGISDIAFLSSGTSSGVITADISALTSSYCIIIGCEASALTGTSSIYNYVRIEKVWLS